MDLNKLLDMGTELGYRLQISGAETYRVEESINRMLQAYDVEPETFAIPNSLIVSVRDDSGNVITRLRRIGYHGTNIDAIERLNAVCRKIESEKPPLETAQKMLNDTYAEISFYKMPVLLLGYFLISLGFSIFFGATFFESLFSGMLGLLCGLVLEFMSHFHANDFFKIIVGGFIITLGAQGLALSGILSRADGVAIGALMILVPGVGITNTMRDIIFGDILSGMNRLVHVIISAVAIGIGTGGGLFICRSFFEKGEVSFTSMPDSALLQCTFAFIACVGFGLLYHLRGIGICFSVAGGVPGWLAYLLCVHLGTGDFFAGFIGAVVVALYGEVMARIRKFPATSYITTSILPLVPGASIYYAIVHLLNDNPAGFSERVVYVAGFAGSLAVGVLLVSSCFRMFSTWKWFRKRKGIGKYKK